jgi:hypothetical protein
VASGNFEHRRDCYHLIFIIPRCALSANQSATAGALDPTHWACLTVGDLHAMRDRDPLSYFTTRSLMGSRIANEEFEKCLPKQRQQPTTPLVSLIWGELADKEGAPRHVNGQYDLYRDVGEICDHMFERENLPIFIGNIYNGPLVLQAPHVDSDGLAQAKASFCQRQGGQLLLMWLDGRPPPGTFGSTTTLGEPPPPVAFWFIFKRKVGLAFCLVGLIWRRIKISFQIFGFENHRVFKAS